MNTLYPRLGALLLLPLLLLLAMTPAASAQPGTPSTTENVSASMVAPADLEWTEMIPGVAFAPAYGDWQIERHGKFIRFDPGASAPMHTHSNAYHGVLLEGHLTNPYAGETDPPEMGPGTHWFVPGEAEHSNTCVSAEPCLFYTYGDDAWDIAVIEE